MNLKCLFGFHDWKSEYVTTLPASETRGNGVTIHVVARAFWDNTCRRCGEVSELTYRYEREPAKEK